MNNDILLVFNQAFLFKISFDHLYSQKHTSQIGFNVNVYNNYINKLHQIQNLWVNLFVFTKTFK